MLRLGRDYSLPSTPVRPSSRTVASVRSKGQSSGVTRADCDLGGGPCPSGIDQVAVSDTDGANAAHTFVLDWPYSAIWPNCTFTEQIVTTDSTGTHILDRITTQTRCDRPPPAMQLSQLSLSGHTLTWSHAGSPRSAQLN